MLYEYIHILLSVVNAHQGVEYKKTYGCTMQGEDFKLKEMKTTSHKFVIWLTKTNVVFTETHKIKARLHVTCYWDKT